jgi:hypothetical protein
MKYIAWPAAFLIFGLVFIFVFRKAIYSLLMKIQKISKDGIQTNNVIQTQKDVEKKPSADELMKSFDSVVLLDFETAIKKDLESRQLDSKEAIDILSRHLAATQLALRFESINTSIYGSQISLLKYLNSRVPQGEAVENIKSYFYDSAAVLYPDLYNHYPFEAYLHFLVSRTLIVGTGNTYNITNLGRDFLIYLVQSGKSEVRLY